MICYQCVTGKHELAQPLQFPCARFQQVRVQALSRFKVYNQHMVSHRLRDTFAASMLSRGVPLEEVSKMLGNSLKVCERHYGKRVQSRQDRLDTLVMGTFKKLKR